MRKLEGQTFNVIQDNIEKLKNLFPEVFTENKIDIDKLRLVLGENVEKEKERYEFSWYGKTKAIQLAQKQTTGTLRPCREDSVDWDNTQNLYLEGDNLEVLRILQNSYRNKVKMIYIDPPYNTGKDFVYKDDFHDNVKNYKESINSVLKSNAETNGRYHTNWLNMMYPRLKIARNLLSEKGIIFISIDDNEVANLKKICDEIFGEDNFIAYIANVNNPKGRSDDKYIATAHENILVYQKSNCEILGWEPEEKVINRYNKFDECGKRYREIDLRKTGDNDRREDRPNLYYYFLYNEDTQEFYATKEETIPDGFIQIKPTRKDGSLGNWRWQLETANGKLNHLVPKYSKVNNKWTVYVKDYLTDDLRIKPTTAWTFKDVNSERGTEQFIELGMDKRIFPKPKPLGTVIRMLKMCTEKDDIILDFFSGSSTTAQAIMELNKEDAGNRRFIMVQIPEPIEESSDAYKAGYKTICEIGKERIRRAGKDIKAQKGKDIDTGFKVFRLDETNLNIWNEESENIEKDLLDFIEPAKVGRTQEDVVYEILLKYGVDLVMPIENLKILDKTIYSIGMGYLIICLENDLTLNHFQEIAELHPSRVVFYDSSFKSDTVRVNAQQILKRFGVEDIRVI
ncbi:hypothetical protein ICE_05347 [Bacillus cereus BAG1X1-2]|uniref:site-specific DNA-methyltransferase n=1 Tax=Bacillus cereus TaxID=1396 RepID=UPI00027AA043|nr:site-specific DNA-methyltransferase [Bacillus cereus]EJS45937.1 hypothetical protein ICE_05347 [Bacillus cereus BAG1X1-2]